MKNVIRLIFSLLCIFTVMAISLNAEEKSYLLRLKNDKDREVLISFEMHAKTRMAMLFMPEIETFLRFSADQWNKFARQGENGEILCESRVATATLEYYMAGQPNQSMNGEMLETLLWVSGLGGRDTTISAKRDTYGLLSSINGVPEKYKDYYKHDLFLFPEQPVKIGDSWERKFTQPMAVDWNQPPYDFDISGVYTLKKVMNEEKEAEVSFKLESKADYAMQNGAKVQVDVLLIREGSMVINLADGFPLSVKSRTRFDFVFSENNYVRSEEDYSSLHQPWAIKDKAEEDKK